MKNLLFLVLLIATQQLYAQTETLLGNSFITTVDHIIAYGLKPDGSKDSSQKFKIPKGTKFNSNGFTKSNDVKITFWNYTAASQTLKSTLKTGYSFEYSKATEYIAEWADNKDFVMDLNDFNTGCKTYHGNSDNFTWGIMTLPIKARFGNKKERIFDLEENLNLGFTFGWRHQLQGEHEKAINCLIGVSVSRVRTDSISLKNNYPAPQSSIASALTFSAGVLYQYETFQVGIFAGIDNVMGELGRNWKHQGKPWIGFAIGVSLFSRNSSGNETGNNSNK